MNQTQFYEQYTGGDAGFALGELWFLSLLKPCNWFSFGGYGL